MRTSLSVSFSLPMSPLKSALDCSNLWSLMLFEPTWMITVWAVGNCSITTGTWWSMSRTQLPRKQRVLASAITTSLTMELPKSTTSKKARRSLRDCGTCSGGWSRGSRWTYHWSYICVQISLLRLMSNGSKSLTYKSTDSALQNGISYTLVGGNMGKLCCFKIVFVIPLKRQLGENALWTIFMRFSHIPRELFIVYTLLSLSPTPPTHVNALESAWHFPIESKLPT